MCERERAIKEETGKYDFGFHKQLGHIVYFMVGQFITVTIGKHGETMKMMPSTNLSVSHAQHFPPLVSG